LTQIKGHYTGQKVSFQSSIARNIFPFDSLLSAEPMEFPMTNQNQGGQQGSGTEQKPGQQNQQPNQKPGQQSQQPNQKPGQQGGQQGGQQK
jgi:type VI secretion system secreted protein VgrG